MTLFLSSDAFKGVKAQQKHSFVAKMYLQITTNPMLTKQKHPLKYIFGSEQKHHHQFLFFPEGVMSLHLSKFGF